MGLYIIQADIGSSSFVKIGITNGSPSERLADIATGCPVKPYLVAYDPRAGLDDEQHLHRRLANWRSHREWFHYSGDVVLFARVMRALFPHGPDPKEERSRLAVAMRFARQMTEARNGQDGKEGLGSVTESDDISVTAYKLTPTLRPWLVNP